MIALEVSGVVKNGRLPTQVAERISEVLHRMEERRLVITIREQKRRRVSRGKPGPCRIG